MDPVPLIGNPAAGGGRGAGRLREAEALLAAAGLRTRLHRTRGPRDAVGLARRLADEGHARLFVCGGDGTFSEVCEGVLAVAHRPVLGFLPAGTGNDFLRDFGIHDRAEAARRIAAGRDRAFDAVRVETDLDLEAGEPGRTTVPADGADSVGVPSMRHFINVLGSGFIARAGATANRNFKWLGRRAYTAGVLWETLRMDRNPVRLRLDGQDAGAVMMVAVCNSVHTGGGMRIAPGARPNDGLLDVMAVHDLGRRELLKVFPGIFDGSHVHHPKVRMHRARRVELEAPEPSPLLVDGDLWGAIPARIEVVPGALRLLA